MKINYYKIQHVANMEMVDDYKDVIRCLGKLIELAEACNLKCALEGNRERHTITIQIFVREIICYIHEAYDCMRAGRLREANMLLRAAVENYFLLSAIDQNQDKYLAELWQIYSIMATMKLISKNREVMASVKGIAESYGMDVKNIKWGSLRKPNGWLYPVLPEKGNISIYELCKYLGPEYEEIYSKDYRMLSEFVHSNSYFQKEVTFAFYSSLVSILIRIAVAIMRVCEGWLEVDQKLEEQWDKFWWMMEKYGNLT